MHHRRLTGMIVLVALAAVASGCAIPAYRIHPDFEPRMKNVRTVGLAAPDVKIYALTAGGVREQRNDWSEQGRKAITQAVVAYFKDEGVPVKVLPLKETAPEMDDLQALYRAVSDSVLDHTYSDTQRFPDKVSRFEYSVGSTRSILDGSGAHALVIVRAFDEISTGGRKALKVLTSPLSLLTGVTPRSGYTALSIALVDASGAVLWYTIDANEGGYDLRNPDSAASFVNRALSDFPRWTR